MTGSELPSSIPGVYEKARPILYTVDGRKIIVRAPIGFATHPAVQQSIQEVLDDRQ